MPLPPLNLSASSGASAGAQTVSSPFNGGTINFGGSGMGGAAGGFNLGALVSQYWPILAVAGAIWYVRRKRAR